MLRVCRAFPPPRKEVTVTTSCHVSQRSRARILIALLGTTAALIGAAQAPTPAVAMIASPNNEADCLKLFGIWDWFNETCELNFGGGSGSSDSGGADGGGGGTGEPGGDSNGDSTSAPPLDNPEGDALAAAEAKAQGELEDLLQKEMERKLEELYGQRGVQPGEHEWRDCVNMRARYDLIDRKPFEPGRPKRWGDRFNEGELNRLRKEWRKKDCANRIGRPGLRLR